MEEQTADFGDEENQQELAERYATGVLRVPEIPQEMTLRQALYTSLSTAIMVSWMAHDDLTTNYTWMAGMVLFGLVQRPPAWYRKHFGKDVDEYAAR